MNDGAYYLAGYCLECALKACIAKATRRHDFPDKKTVVASHTHSIIELLKVAHLEKECSRARTAQCNLSRQLGYCISWSEDSRYRIAVIASMTQRPLGN
jgi:HEPN domain-containing protein